MTARELAGFTLCRGRHPAHRDGQEGQGQDGQAAREVPRGRIGQRHRRGDGRARSSTASPSSPSTASTRRTRAAYARDRLPDRLPEGQLPARVHDRRCSIHMQGNADKVADDDRRLPDAGHRRAGAGHQRSAGATSRSRARAIRFGLAAIKNVGPTGGRGDRRGARRRTASSSRWTTSASGRPPSTTSTSGCSSRWSSRAPATRSASGAGCWPRSTARSAAAERAGATRVRPDVSLLRLVGPAEASTRTTGSPSTGRRWRGRRSCGWRRSCSASTSATTR